MNVTIGMPIFNAGDYLKETLDCLLNFNCPIVISDNASTDDTQEICEAYALINKNIKYIRQEKTIGAIINYKECTDLANTKYFMLITGRDLVDSNYVEVLVNELEKDKETVLAYTEPRFFLEDINNYTILNGEKLEHYEHHLMSSSASVRVSASIIYNKGFYQQFGMYKLDILKKAFQACGDNLRYYGSDILFITRISEYGKMVRTKETSLYRRRNVNRPIITQIVKYLKYYFPEHFRNEISLNNIYEDHLMEVNNAQISILKDIYRKDEILVDLSSLLIQIAEVNMKEKYGNPFFADMLKEYACQYKETYNVSVYNDIISQKRIVIFGTGSMSVSLYEALEINNNVIAFVDNFNTGKFKGLQIENVDWLLENQNEYDYIISSIEGFHDLEVIRSINLLLDVEKMISWKSCVLYREYLDI